MKSEDGIVRSLHHQPVRQNLLTEAKACIAQSQGTQLKTKYFVS